MEATTTPAMKSFPTNDFIAPDTPPSKFASWMLDASKSALPSPLTAAACIHAWHLGLIHPSLATSLYSPRFLLESDSGLNRGSLIKEDAGKTGDVGRIHVDDHPAIPRSMRASLEIILRSKISEAVRNRKLLPPKYTFITWARVAMQL